MKSKHFLGFLVAGVAIAAISGGCSSGDVGETGGSGPTSSSSSSASSSSTMTGVAVSVTSSSSGMPPDTNVDCMTGTALTFGMVESGTLEPVDADADFYTFTGTQGQAILISTDAKPTGAEFDTAYADVVITLYDPMGNQIAQNDDPYPHPAATNDSALYTILPENGTYCVRMTECGMVFGSMSCAPASGITDTSYRLSVAPVDPMLDSIISETEPNDTDAMANVIEYAKNMGGQYYLSLAYGGFSSATDVDVYRFTVPMDVPVTSGRSICNFEFDFFFPGTVDNSGSTAVTGVTAYMTTAADPMTRIAETDITAAMDDAASIAMPCTFGTDYLLFMTRAAGVTADVNDFYFIAHAGSGSNPPEVEPNDTLQMAQALMQQANPNGTYSHFVDGDITMAPMDRDFFRVDVPPGLTKVTVACGAQRLGSGLRSFTATILDSNGMPIAGGSMTEDPTKDLVISMATIPTGVTTLNVQTDALMQSPTVTSNSYRCGIHLLP